MVEGERGNLGVIGGVHLLPWTWLGGEVLFWRKRRGSAEGHKIENASGVCFRTWYKRRTGVDEIVL